MEITLDDMGIRQSNVGYDMAYYLSKKTNTSMKYVLEGVANKNIIVTNDKIAFAVYLYNKAMRDVGMKRTTPLMLAEVLLWMEFVFIPNSNNIYVFKQDGEVHYIFVKGMGDELYGN